MLALKVPRNGSITILYKPTGECLTVRLGPKPNQILFAGPLTFDIVRSNLKDPEEPTHDIRLEVLPQETAFIPFDPLDNQQPERGPGAANGPQ